MKRILLILAMAVVTSFTVMAQSDPVVLEVDGQQIRQKEFMKEFKAVVGDNLSRKAGVTAAEKHKALTDYVDLYANFRAKVADARSMGLDTARDLERELRRYRNELAGPYLIDSVEMQRLLNEAYERHHYAVHAAHILVRVMFDAPAADTLKALQHALALRERIMNGEDFYAVALEEARAMAAGNAAYQPRPDEGDLGYFTAFDMVYPFENGVYNLEVGEVSQPVRTQYGYHIIKLFDKVPLYGKTTLAHIWLRSADSATNSRTILNMYKQLQDGVAFKYVARASDDRTTVDNGGEFPEPLSFNQMLPEYVHELAQLKEGEFSKPFRTRYGWHIVKVIKKDTIPPLENMVAYYKQKMSRDQRGDASRRTFAAHSRERYGIIDCTRTPMPVAKTKKGKKAPVQMMASLDELIEKISDSVMRGRWFYRDTIFTDLRPLIKTPERDYNVLDLADFIFRRQRKELITTKAYYVQNKFDEYLDSVTIQYADKRLEQENPEFAAIVDDYRRGLMIFNYNEKYIWSKAVQDTAGFAAFYKRESVKKRMDNPEDSIYFWHIRARVLTATIADSAMLAPEKGVKLMQKALKKGWSTNEVKEALQKASKKNSGSSTAIDMELEQVEQGHQRLLKESQWAKGVYVQPQPKGYRLLMVQDLAEPCLKTQPEARGYYLNEYQNEIERNLNESLRKKYNVKIHWDVVDKISY